MCSLTTSKTTATITLTFFSDIFMVAIMACIIFLHFQLKKGYNFSPKDFYFPFPKIRPYPVEVVGSCNGVLCLEDNVMEGKVVLWNPSIDEFKFLPQSFVERPPGAAYTKFYCSSFGFDPKFENYKVVRFVKNVFTEEDGSFSSVEAQVELYSLKSDSWKEISDPGAHPYSNPSAYVNGIYYWLIWGSTDDILILSFDFANEKFSSLLLPEVSRPSSQDDFNLLEFDEFLALIVYPILETKKSFDLKVMKESWSIEFVVHLSGAERPLGFWKKDELFLESINREVLLFDRATGEVKYLSIFDYPQTMQLIPYVDSSVSLNVKSELEELDIENKEV